jgi:parallel beta-helix repeat protein
MATITPSISFVGVAAANSNCTPISGETTINSSGCYYLTDDIEPAVSSDSFAIQIAADDVIFDGQGHNINATNAGSWSDGIRIGDANQIRLSTTQYSNVTIRDVTIRGWHEGGKVVNTTTVEFRNVGFTDNTNGLVLQHADDSILKDTSFEGDKYALSLGAAPNTTIENVHIGGSDARATIHTGLQIYGSEHTTMRNSSIQDSDLLPFYVQAPRNDRSPTHFVHDIDTSNTIDGKPIYYYTDETDLLLDAPTGVGFLGVVNSTNITVRNYQLSGMGQGLLVANSDTVLVEDIGLTGNYYGFTLSGTTNATVRDSVFDQSGRFGIEATDVTETTFDNVTVTNTADTGFSDRGGIWVENGLGTTVQDSTIWNNEYNGIVVYGNGTTIIGNDVKGSPTGDGIFTFGYGSTVTHNVVDNYQGGIDANAVDETIAFNQITSTGTGIIADGDNTTVHSNVLSGAVEYGIDVGPHAVTVQNNSVTSSEWGVYVDNPSAEEAVHVVDNTLTDNVRGIVLDSAEDVRIENNSVVRSTEWGFFSDDDSLRANVTELDIGYPLAFTGTDVALTPETSPPSDPDGSQNVSRFLVVQGTESDDAVSWMDVKMPYTDAEAANVDESTLSLWRHNGSVWQAVQGSSVDTSANVVTGNVTELPEGEIQTVAILSGAPDQATNQPPTASFTYSPSSPAAGELVTFDASSSGDTDGSIASYEWDFNADGIPDEFGQQTSRVYETDGDSPVKLTVTDDDGETAVASEVITVGGDIDIGGPGPIASIPVDSCGVTIETPGTYEITGDLQEDTDYTYCINITVSGVTLDGQDHTIEPTSSATGVQGVLVDGFDEDLQNVVIRNISFYETLTGVKFQSAEDATVDDVTVLAGANGVVVDSGNVAVSNSAITATNPIVSRLVTRPEGPNIAIENVYVEGENTGIEVIGARNVTVRDSYVVVAPQQDGIKVAGGNLTVADTFVSKTTSSSGTVTQPIDAGVRARYANVTVANNIISAVTRGIDVEDSTLLATDNLVTDAQRNAIIATNSTATVRDNEFVASHLNTTNINVDDGAIQLTNSTASATNNSVGYSSQDGIVFESSSGSASNNSLSSVEGIGITVEGWSYRVDGASVPSVEDYPTVTLTNNTVAGGAVGAAFYQSVVTATENTFTDVRTGVHAGTASLSTIRNNDFDTRERGVTVYEPTDVVVANNDLRVRNGSAKDTGIYVLFFSGESLTVRNNTIDAARGVYFASQNLPAENRVVANDFTASDVALINDAGEFTVNATLNYFGPRGPTDGDVVGNVTAEPFLTTKEAMADVVDNGTTQQFGYNVAFEAGKVYAFGTPGPLEDDLATVFDSFEGAVYIYDSTSDSWSLATGDEVLGAMEAVAVVPTTTTTAVIDFADAPIPLATSRQFTSTGWHFVAPRMYTDAEEAFSTRTLGTTDLVGAFAQPDGQALGPGDSFGQYTFSPDRTSQGDAGTPRVSAFTGYFVYVDDTGTVPGAVPRGVRSENVEQIIEDDQ